MQKWRMLKQKIVLYERVHCTAWVSLRGLTDPMASCSPTNLCICLWGLKDCIMQHFQLGNHSLLHLYIIVLASLQVPFHEWHDVLIAPDPAAAAEEYLQSKVARHLPQHVSVVF
jgi:hypothetical protein